jgi:plasmid stability protein
VPVPIHSYIRVTLINVITRNVTFNLPVDLIRQAKIYAAEHDTTVNAIVRDLLKEKMTAEARTRAAAERFLKLAEHGPCSSVDPSSIRREELYER